MTQAVKVFISIIDLVTITSSELTEQEQLARGVLTFL